MDVDLKGELADAPSDESDEDEDEIEEVKMLKSKRRELLRLLCSGNALCSARVSSARARPRRVLVLAACPGQPVEAHFPPCPRHQHQHTSFLVVHLHCLPYRKPLLEDPGPPRSHHGPGWHRN